jgi:hypothetical protein
MYNRVDGGPFIGYAVLAIEHVEIKSMKIVLQTNIMAVQLHLRLSKLLYAILRRMKKIINIHLARLSLRRSVLVK